MSIIGENPVSFFQHRYNNNNISNRMLYCSPKFSIWGEFLVKDFFGKIIFELKLPTFVSFVPRLYLRLHNQLLRGDA